MKALVAIFAAVLLGCASASSPRSPERSGPWRGAEVAFYDLDHTRLPAPNGSQFGPGLVILENARPEHLESIELAFGKSHPQSYDRIADLGLVVRAQGQLVRLEPIEVGNHRSEILLVLESPGDKPSMFHAVRRNTEPFSRTDDLLVFDPRLGRVMLSRGTTQVFLVYPRGGAAPPEP